MAAGCRFIRSIWCRLDRRLNRDGHIEPTHTIFSNHAAAFEPMPPGDPFEDMMNAPRKYVVSRTLVDELHLHVYPLSLGGGKRLLPEGVHATFRLTGATPYPTGVVGLHYERDRRPADG